MFNIDNFSNIQTLGSAITTMVVNILQKKKKKLLNLS